MNLYPNIRMRSAWFNSRANGPDAVYWKRLGGYERGIREAPVSTADRLSLYGLLLKWVVARSVDLFDDVVVMIRGRTSPRQDARTSGD